MSCRPRKPYSFVMIGLTLKLLFLHKKKNEQNTLGITEGKVAKMREHIPDGHLEDAFREALIICK